MGYFASTFHGHVCKLDKHPVRIFMEKIIGYVTQHKSHLVTTAWILNITLGAGNVIGANQPLFMTPNANAISLCGPDYSHQTHILR